MKSTESFLSAISNRSLPIQDHDGLLEALWAADSSTLLMVLTRLTGDEDFLQRFEPHLCSPMLGPNTVPADLSRELRDRLFARLTQLDAAPECRMSYQLFMKMASIGVGERVSEEFVPLLSEQTEFVKKLLRAKKVGRSVPVKNFKMLVIDAGLTGLLADITSSSDFNGETMQAAGWTSGIDTARKPGALIGSALGAGQLSSVISDKVEDLAVYLRSRSWVFNDRSYSARVGDSIKWALIHIPYFSEWFAFRECWIATEGLCQSRHRFRVVESKFVDIYQQVGRARIFPNFY
jgi:hypothetical protein